MNYRREIDGLRALAVIPVILFHAGFEAFSGGFVGVDVFFVISGYLITTIILSELEQDKFSIINFYERRARRILPALFLVMLVSTPFAWLWLVPREMKDFSESLFAVSLFLSNHLFLSEKGYFDTAAELKPLLHTWSLAVEEQYYLLFPPLLMILWRFGKRRMLTTLVLAFLASLALAQWASITEPSAAFYLLPTRGWELLLGAFIAMYLAKADRYEFGKTVSEVGAWSGIGLILYAVLAFSKTTPVPGLYSLIPTVGTLLIVLFATQQTSAGRFMGNIVFVSIGLVSYSAYLWHQPLFAFAKHSKIIESDLAYLGLSCITILLGYISWRYVETPFRQRERVTRRQVFAFSATGLIFFSIIGVVGHVKNGFPKEAAANPTTVEHRTDRNFVVLGDSHAGHLVSGLRSITSGTVSDYSVMGCIPFRDVDGYDYRSKPGECVRRANNALNKAIKDAPTAIIVLSLMGPVYLDGTAFNGKDVARVTGQVAELITNKAIKDKREVFEIGLRTTLKELSRIENSSLVFAIDIPELGIDYGCNNPKKELSIGVWKLDDLVAKVAPDQCHVSRVAYENRIRNYKTLVTRVVAEFPKIHIFDPSIAFCDADTCTGFDGRHGYLYHDADHLSHSGSHFVAAKLIDFLQGR